MNYLEKVTVTCNVGLFRKRVILHVQGNLNLLNKYEELVSFITLVVQNLLAYIFSLSS